MLKINNYSNYILKDISFNTQDKNLIILGSNGAGKTTLAKVLSGLISTPNVELTNVSLQDIEYKKRVDLINYIPPKLEIFDEYISVSEFLVLNKIYNEDNLDDVLEKLDITHLKDKSCKKLSSGESQLVLLASAILHNAKYTILDEPTSNLDPQKLKKVFTLFKEEDIMKNKIIITHNLNLAYKLGYDILFIENGTIQFSGTSETFFSTSNLDVIYDDAVKKIADNIVVSI